MWITANVKPCQEPSQHLLHQFAAGYDIYIEWWLEICQRQVQQERKMSSIGAYFFKKEMIIKTAMQAKTGASQLVRSTMSGI